MDAVPGLKSAFLLFRFSGQFLEKDNIFSKVYYVFVITVMFLEPVCIIASHFSEFQKFEELPGYIYTASGVTIVRI